MTGFRLHTDDNFNYEALRSLGTTRYYGSDVRETLTILPKIKDGDFEDWYNEWTALAERVLDIVDQNNLADLNPVTIRNTFFRASHYYFNAEFFLHGEWNDWRSEDAFRQWRKCFDIANAHLPTPGVFTKVPASFGQVPFYLYKAANASSATPKPLVILGGGFDSNMEEMLHAFGFDALERGYNVIIYEGPGQPQFLHDQHVGFIHNWEEVVTPIVDYVFAQSSDQLAYIDTRKIGLLGMSFGGYLAARAAAFEPRLAAVILIDGVSSLFDCCFSASSTDLQNAWRQGDSVRFDELFHRSGASTASTNQRWIHDHGLFSFQEKSGFDWFKKMEKFALDDKTASQITIPAFVGDAQNDIFFKGQPPKVAASIGSNATFFGFTDENAAGAHCASGALVYQNQVIWEWFGKVINDRM